MCGMSGKAVGVPVPHMSAAAHEPAAQALGPRLQQRRDRCEVVARRVQVVAREVEAVQREVGARALELVSEHVHALQHLGRYRGDVGEM